MYDNQPTKIKHGTDETDFKKTWHGVSWTISVMTQRTDMQKYQTSMKKVSGLG